MLSKLGLSERIYARSCKIYEINNEEKKKFLNENHIQGKDSSTIYYGLKHDDKIVAVMTFCKSRYNKNYDWELSRFACAKNLTVVGGFSKLLKYFRIKHSGTIISYADRCLSEGNVYSKNGFKLIKINAPGARYVNLKISQKRLHRSNVRNKQNKDDYRIIWDCGILTYVIE